MKSRSFVFVGFLFASFFCPDFSGEAQGQEFRGTVVGPLAENDGYYARITGEPFKSMSWNQAKGYAEGLFIVRGGKRYTGFLFTPNTPTENAFVLNTIRPNEDWIGIYQAPRPRSASHNWRFLNNRAVNWNGWGRSEPDDQKRGVLTRCRVVSFFNGFSYTSNGESSSFAPTVNDSVETGCENCGMMRVDGGWKDKECQSHGNGFIVEFRRL